MTVRTVKRKRTGIHSALATALVVLALTGAAGQFSGKPAQAAEKTYHWIGEDGKAGTPPAGWTSSVPLIATADVAAGKSKAQICMMCHTVTKDGGTKIGPNLCTTSSTGRTPMPTAFPIRMR
ncbi:MAG: hypothetical protein GC185_00585 [Alphaproteobacteria bacterium]|nr:hypothetical protein [Alphaproteobacteria bacterium]